MHGEYSGQAASADGGGVHDETREQLHRYDDLVRRTESGVDEFVVEGTRQLKHRDALIANRDHHRRHAGNDAVREHTAVHEYRAEGRHEAAQFCVSRHDLVILQSSDGLPVRLHVLHASTYVAVAQQQGTIIHSAHEPVTQRTYRPQLRLEVFLLEEDVQHARYHGEGD